MKRIADRINTTGRRWIGRKKSARKARERRTPPKIPDAVKDTEAYKKVMESRKITDYIQSLKIMSREHYFRKQDCAKKDRPILHEWFGDPVVQDKPENIMRICLQNGNGVYTLPEKGKVHLMSEAMLNYDINFLGMPENHINVSSPKTHDIQDVFTSYHPGGLCHHSNTRVNHQLPTKTQQGGVSSFIDTSLASKFNGVEYDPLGRWHCTNILAKDSVLKIYVVYRVCKEPTGCQNSAYQHQEEKLNDKNIFTPPDQQVVDDLKKQIEKDRENKCKIIVMADANEKITIGTPRIHNMLTDLGLVNIMETRATSALPPTHQSGSEAIDHVWATEDIADFVRRAGIAPLNFTMQSDHRALILDIDISSLCETELIHFTPYERR